MNDFVKAASWRHGAWLIFATGYVLVLLYASPFAHSENGGTLYPILACCAFAVLSRSLELEEDGDRISRTQRLAVIVLPCLGILFAAATLQCWLAPHLERTNLIRMDLLHRPTSDDEKYELLVTSFLWRVTSEPPPVVTAPDGESHALTGMPLISGLPFNVYNPYEAQMSWGKGFVGYQLSRALEDCCEIELSPEAALARYAVSTEPLELGFKKHPEIVGRGDLTRLSINPLAMTLFPFLFFAASIYWPRRGQNWVGPELRTIVGLLFFVPLFNAFGLAPNPHAWDGAGGILLRFGALRGEVARLFHQHWVLVPMLWGCTMGILYWVVLRRFERMDLKVSRRRAFTLGERAVWVLGALLILLLMGSLNHLRMGLLTALAVVGVMAIA